MAIEFGSVYSGSSAILSGKIQPYIDYTVQNGVGGFTVSYSFGFYSYRIGWGSRTYTINENGSNKTFNTAFSGGNNDSRTYILGGTGQFWVSANGNRTINLVWDNNISSVTYDGHRITRVAVTASISGYGNSSTPNITACTAPTYFDVTNKVIIPGKDITVKWSGEKGGINNNIAFYDLWWRVTRDDGTWGVWEDSNVYEGHWEYHVNAPASSYISKASGSIIYLANRAAQPYMRGRKAQYRIRVTGSQGVNYSSPFKLSPEFRINSLPTITNIGMNKDFVISDGEPITFSWLGTDSDGDTLTYFYKFDNNASSVVTTSDSKTTNSSITYDLSINQETYFHIMAFDGYEYSSISHFKIKYNTRPTMNFLETNWDKEGQYIVQAKLSFTANANDENQKTSYKITRIRELKAGSNMFMHTQFNTDKEEFIDNLSGVPENVLIYYKVSAYDGYEYSDSLVTDYRAKKAPKPNPPISLSATGEKTEIPNIYESKATLNWVNNEDNPVGISYVHIEGSVSNNNSVFDNWKELFKLNFSSSLNSNTYNNTTNQRGSYLKFRIRYEDSLGQFSEYIESNNILRKNLAPELPAASFIADLNGQSYFPWEKTSLKLLWEKPIDEYPEDILYSISLYIPDITVDSQIQVLNKSVPAQIKISQTEIITLSSEVLLEGEQKYISISSDNFLKLLYKEIVNPKLRNMVYLGCYFSLKSYDNFGVESNTITLPFNLDLRSSPILNYHIDGIGENTSYYLENSVLGKISTTNTSSQIPYSQENNKYPMVNSDETITFYWKPGIDNNDGTIAEKDIVSYIIYKRESETEGSLNNDNNKSNYTILTSISSDNLSLNSQGFYYYQYKLPETNTNKVVKFGITARDTTNLESNFVQFPLGVEICRLSPPVLVLNSVDFEDIEADNRKIISDIDIKDIGGSITKRANIGYSARRNLERIPTDRKIEINLQYSESINFPSNPRSFNIYSLTNASYPFPEKPLAFSNLQTPGGLSINKSYFIRLEIKVYSSKTNYKTSYSNVLLLRSLAAPVSFRNKGLGINNSFPEGRLHITAKGNNIEEELAIFGDSKTSGNTRFIIDLINGALYSGIIDGGNIDNF